MRLIHNPFSGRLWLVMVHKLAIATSYAYVWRMIHMNPTYLKDI